MTQSVNAVDFSHVKTLDEFEQEISIGWQNMVDGILHVAALCLEASQTLTDRELTELRSRLKMSGPTFSKLKTIGEDKQLNDPRYARVIPASYSTLHQLTLLKKQQFENAVRNRQIHPDMQRSDAEALRLPKKAKRSQISKPRVIAAITTDATNLSDIEQEIVDRAIKDLERVHSITVKKGEAFAIVRGSQS